MGSWATFSETLLQLLMRLGSFALGWFFAKSKRRLEEVENEATAGKIEANIALSGDVTSDELCKQRELLQHCKADHSK